MNFRNYIRTNLTLLDGAMGTVLQSKNLLEGGECPELLNLTRAAEITAIHKAYVDAGSVLVCTNTFQANRYKLPSGVMPSEVIAAGIKNARASGVLFVGQDIGPSGRLIEPMGDMTFEEAYEMFAEQVIAGVNSGTDVFILETFMSLYEMKAALLAVKENSTLPVICSMSFEGLRTMNGTQISSMALTLEGLGADAIGFNCSVGPEQIIPAARELLKWTNLPVMVKVNAGLPNGRTYNPREFAYYYKILLEMGVSLIGGCCGTDERFIRELKRIMDGRSVMPRPRVIPEAVCTERQTVVLDGLKLVGERINPTGKKPFKEALKAGDYKYAVNEALSQVDSGASLLDVNCGLPEIDEVKVLPALTKLIQESVHVPLMLDSANAAALEAALRVYNGVPVVNSVNGDPENLERILPLIKKYGAFVIGLALDQNGIPSAAEGRIKVANRILAACRRHGIPKEHVIIDALTLTAATGEYKASECLKTVEMLAKKGIKTNLGISNISFGLPNREYLNLAFLMQAAGAGLTLAIVNPSAFLVKELYAAARTLEGDLAAIRSVAPPQQTASVAAPQQNASASANSVADRQRNLEYCIIKGYAEEARRLAADLLLIEKADEIIDGRLIKALDEVGRLYETGKIFLPELIASAEAAKAAFDVLRESLKGRQAESRGKIILATVKGDIHDIGKNIVRAVLENYGYTVFDLGRDVPPETVVQAALREGAPLVGLSALMTTTAVSMEITIKALRAAGYHGKIMVGGAVITKEYADKIGADYYAKNANESARIAKEVFGQETV
jgi:5-methyltetrahydrofolate--homocysteine methyltransferase